MRALPPLDDYSRDDLLRLYAAVMAKLRDLGYVRSSNSPVADVAEQVVADLYGVGVASANTAGHDLITRDGTKIQVKGLWRLKPGRRNFSPIRSDDYDLVVAVVFDPAMQVSELWRIPKAVVDEKARWSRHINGRLLSLKREVREDPRVQRIPLDRLTRPD